jgi:hypothetical protein
MIFVHTSLIQEGAAALFYRYSRPIKGYVIAGILVGNSTEAKLDFAKVWTYFVSEIVQADDIYASIAIEESNSMFANYLDYYDTIDGLKIYKVDNFLKKQYSSYEKHLERAGSSE